MTKEQWIRHIEFVTGLKRPSDEDGAMSSVWKQAYVNHKTDLPYCEHCKARRSTRRATRNRKNREECYKSAGLVKVIGSVSGQTYWE